jgi:hypothetical protein
MGSLPSPSYVVPSGISFKTDWDIFVRQQFQNPNSIESAILSNFLADYSETALGQTFIHKNLQDCIPVLIDEEFDPRKNPNPDPDHSKFINSSLNIVTETFFRSGDPTFVTEKTYKAFKYLQPFVMLSTPKFLQKLEANGYQTFNKWIDQSYDNIDDDYTRIEMALNSAERFFARSKEMIAADLYDMKDVLLHNYWHMMQEAKTRHVYVLTALMWYTQDKIERIR